MIDALYKLYPQIVYTNGEKAFDADGNEVVYDLEAVLAKAQEDQEAQENHRQNAIAKLAALGLTADEIAAIGVK